MASVLSVTFRSPNPAMQGHSQLGDLPRLLNNAFSY